MKRTNTGQRLIALLLTLSMTLGMLSATGWAAEIELEDTPDVESVQQTEEAEIQELEEAAPAEEPVTEEPEKAAPAEEPVTEEPEEPTEGQSVTEEVLEEESEGETVTEAPKMRSQFVASTTWDSDQTISATQTINGLAVNSDMTLTISEGVTLTINGGIHLDSYTLTVEGGGKLAVNGAGGEEGDFYGGAGTNAPHAAVMGANGTLVVNGAEVEIHGGRGGDGGWGEDGYDGVDGSDGGAGGKGAAGVEGSVLVKSGILHCWGGDGGDGGWGGDGGYGGYGYEAPNPGNGANGGDGGDGEVAICGSLTVDDGYAYVYGGNGGSSGWAGDGGDHVIYDDAECFEYADWKADDGNWGDEGASAIAVADTVTNAIPGMNRDDGSTIAAGSSYTYTAQCLQFSWLVNLTAGANTTMTAGEAFQLIHTGDPIAAVTFTANNNDSDDGYFFTAFNDIGVNGLTMSRVDEATVTISGTPTDDVTYTARAATHKRTVTLTGGDNAVVTPEGKTTQRGLTGAMETVTYTANSGYYFAPFNNKTSNGVTATRTNETTVTVSGTPNNDASIAIPNAELIPVSAVTLNPSEAQTIDIDGVVAFTASIQPDGVLEKMVKWSVDGTNADAVTLYTDADCTAGNEVTLDTATETLTVYAKGISEGSATITVTSNADSTKSASCDVTVEEAATTHTHNGITFTAWTDGLAAEQNGGGKTAANSLPTTAGSYYLRADVTIDRTWQPSGDYDLCLNGHTITADVDGSSGILLTNNVTLNLYDDEANAGRITHAAGKAGIGVQVNQSTFNMHGGTITGNNAGGITNGGGVAVVSGGTFNMHDGIITGNSANNNTAGGVSVGSFFGAQSTFNMYGGTITGNNTTGDGGGVKVVNGTFAVSGSPTITGNVKGGTYDVQSGVYVKGESGSVNNVYLNNDRVITVGGALTNATPIGVAMYEPGVFTTSTDPKAKDYLSNFASDDGEYAVVTKGDELALQHNAHSFTYAASGATITATCDEEGLCDLTDKKVALTIKAPTLTTYDQTGDGISERATLDGPEAFNAATGKNVSADSIRYFPARQEGSQVIKGEVLPKAPADAGDYVAEVTLAGVKTGVAGVTAVTAYVTYAIAKATPAFEHFAFAPPADLTYDGQAKAASVTAKAGVEGMGAVTVGYYSDAGCTTAAEPRGVGTYYVGVTVAEGDNFLATAGGEVLHGEGWAFRIAKEPAVAARVSANGRTYDGTSRPLVKVEGEATGGKMQYALGKDAKTAPADGWSTSVPAATDAGTYHVWYRVRGDANHGDLAAKPVKTTVAPREAKLAWKGTSFTYDGKSHAPTATVSNLAAGDKCSVTVAGAAKAAGSHTATATKLGNANYKLPAKATQAFAIAQREAKLAWKGTSFTYDGKSHVPTAAVGNLASGDKCSVTVAGAAKAAGSHTATATKLGNANYKLPAKATQAFAIAPREAKLAWKGTSFTYDGKSHAPTATVSNLAAGDKCSVTVAGAAKAAGSHTATATKLGNANYKLPAKATQAFTIAKATPAKVKLTSIAEVAAKTYTGKAIKPTPAVKAGKATLKAGTDYTLSYKANVNAGTATVTAEGKGNYAGTVSTTFQISPAEITSIAEVADQGYTGKAVRPKPAVKAGKRALEAGTDFSYSYKNNVKAGTATVTAKGRGNYAGTVKATFKVVAPSCSDRAHVQGTGWQAWAKGGSAVIGTSGKGLRLEAIQLRLGESFPVAGGIEYRAHVQTYGWEKAWAKDGATCGTTGQSRRLEAIQVRLTGQMAKKYDVYYRVHAQTYGWMGWAKNGAKAGTAGQAKRGEAVQIVLLPKGAKAPGTTYEGVRQAFSKPFVQG